jgi:lysine/ornithine N-monooxygenase
MEKKEYNNIIIGAGPSGLQLAYYFEKYHIDYIILEKTDSCGTYYKKYPHSKKLLSINKKNNNSIDNDFNLRYDWNSLLNDENFNFTDYSDDYYPSNDDYYKYLNDFTEKFNLKIKYNTNVSNIFFDKNRLNYQICTHNNETYICDKLIIATGLSIPVIPQCKKYITNKKNIIHYSEFDTNNLNIYKNKKLLLVGLGNSSLEIAKLLNNYCANIVITGKSRDLSIISKYDGDIRSNYMSFYDTFLLNCMNALDNKVLTEKEVIVEHKKECSENYGKYYILSNNEEQLLFCNSIKYFDYIIFCTGYKFDLSIFDKDLNILMDGKYPKLNINYESINNNKLFFIGSLMHGFDYRKNSGCFVKGYRYLIKLFFKKNYMITMDKIMKFNTHNDLAYYMYNRINNSSSLYNLPDYIVDIFYYDHESETIFYYNDIIKFDLGMNIIDWNDTNHLYILKLTYDTSEKQNDFKKIGLYNKFNPTMLHPEIDILLKNENNIFILKDKIIFEENLVSNFSDKETYYDKLLRISKSLQNNYIIN